MGATSPSPRPRFELESPLSPAEIRGRVHALLTQSESLRGIAFEHRLEIAMAGSEQHFWSPQLVVTVTPRDGGGSRLAARFGPDPYVWSLYVLLYGALLFITVLTSIFGLVQWSLGMSPVALFAAPGCAVAAGLVYGASFVGQGLGSEQMYVLRASLTRAVDAEPSTA